MIKRKKNNKESYDDFSCFPLRTHLLAIFWFQDAVSPPASLEWPFMVTDIYRAQQCGYYALFSPAFNNIFIL
jgi:hypothetical protein